MITKRAPPTSRSSQLIPGFIAFVVLAIAVLVMGPSRLMEHAKKVETPNDPLTNVAPVARTYVDPLGRFTLAVPAGWRWIREEQTGPGRVLVAGSEHRSLCVQVVESAFHSVDELREGLGNLDRMLGLDSALEDIHIGKTPVIQRTVDSAGTRLCMLDFLYDGRQYHLEITAPREAYELHPELVDEMACRVKVAQMDEASR